MSTAPAPEQATPHPHRVRWLAALVLLVLVGVGLTIAGVVHGDDEQASAKLSQVQASCTDWMETLHSGSQSDETWCTDMFRWMGNQSDGSMVGSMMWQGPDQIGSACHEWIDQDRPGTEASRQQRCDDMVEWMNGHLSSRGGSWMMQDR